MSDVARLLDSQPVAAALAAFISTIRDEGGIVDEEELCALAHHWLDKALPDASAEPLDRTPRGEHVDADA